MTSEYPDGFDEIAYPIETNLLKAPSHSEIHRIINDSISAIQSTMGLSPADQYASVAALLQGMAQRMGKNSYQGHQHSAQTRSLDSGLANLANSQLGATPSDDKVLRVVGLFDSMGELSGGMSWARDRLQEALDGRRGGSWGAPSWVLAPFDPTFFQEGVANTYGLDSKGRTLTAGQRVGSPHSKTYTTGIDVYYTGYSGGGTFDIYIDGVFDQTVDTSVDEDGGAIGAGLLGGQKVEVSVSTGEHSIYIQGNTGTVHVDGWYYHGEGGVEWYGMGRSGISTANVNSYGSFAAHIEAMVNRGESPHLVILFCDTAEYSTDAQVRTIIEENKTLIDQIRSYDSNITIMHCIPHGHGGSASEEDFERFTEIFLRELHEEKELLTVNFWATHGHCGNSYDPYNYSSDGVHWGTPANILGGNTIVDAILSRTVRPIDVRKLPGVQIDTGINQATPNVYQNEIVPAFVDGELVIPENALRTYDNGAATIMSFRSKSASDFLGTSKEVALIYSAIFGIQLYTTTDGVLDGLQPLNVGYTNSNDAHATTKAYVDGNSSTRIATVSATRSLASSDRGKILLCDATLTINLASLATWNAGAYCTLVQTTSNNITVAAAGGQTLYAPNGAASTAQGQEGILRKIASSSWSITWL